MCGIWMFIKVNYYEKNFVVVVKMSVNGCNNLCWMTTLVSGICYNGIGNICSRNYFKTPKI